MVTIDERTKPLQSLLRGELAAVETYGLAINQFNGEPQPLDLIEIQNDHQEAADILAAQVLAIGGRPEPSSGAWGTFAKAVTGTMTLLGNKAALQSLKEGEQHGVQKYEDAMHDPHLDPETKKVIEATLLPRQRLHPQTLDRLMGVLDRR